MDNKKRPRLEVSQNMLNTTTKLKTTLPMATIGGQSFFLSSANDCIGSSNNNVLLTICTDNSNESTEYLSLEESLAQIKQEEEMSGLQYRFVNPLRTSIDGGIGETMNTSSMLPTTVQLPSGCDIYLVKEFLEEESLQQNDAIGITGNIKLDENITSSTSHKILSTHKATSLLPKPAVQTAAGTAVYATEPSSKRSFILETYKKRDDKRRATHNEVERRRRDKINNWIFKLKEMLPDMPNMSNTNNSNSTSITAAVTTAATERNSNHSRPPPSDSKSQILIKACEYIKTMQEEIKSLRECLSENESLRSSNQRLQNELDKLKKSNCQSQDFSSRFINNNNNNITLNTLNSSGNIFGLSTPGAAATYTKRELIIRDYVD